MQPLFFFSSPTLAQGFCLRKMGWKALGRGCSFLLLPFIFLALRIFFPSPSLMWFSALSSDAKKLPFCPFPFNWHANFSQFVFENPAGYKLHYRRNTTGYPGSKCLSTAIKAVYSYFIKRSVFVLFSYYCQFLPYERHFSKFQGENCKNIKTC